MKTDQVKIRDARVEDAPALASAEIKIAEVPGRLASRNKNAILLYEKMGFVVEGIRLKNDKSWSKLIFG